ncbi:MAG TPA: 2,3-bisphosphoglycerate-independent phosphoglycerate mutase, partial [Candidatus Ozemobacteraceae bacterium]|nr:2,3-bisphosphoglycerate-independent phosphoglycerate mutase [Candidatus Ozemobacteraceae bacterium]
MNKKKVLLLILDGFGLSEKTEGNAVRQANPEFLNKLFKERPLARLTASGPAIGLPAGQKGNSEVGHLAIAAGRAVQQDITRINRAIEDGTFQENPVLRQFFSQTLERGRALHLIGLIGTGGIHSHQRHLCACLEAAKQAGLRQMFVHVVTDGKDTSPTAGITFVQELQAYLQKLGVGRIATISGRYYAMDRDQRWDRTEKAYLAMVHGVGNRISEPVLAMEASYKANLTDEFVLPVVIEGPDGSVATINDEDSVLSFNFRADRVRQLTQALSAETFTGFSRKTLNIHFLSLGVTPIWAVIAEPERPATRT